MTSLQDFVKNDQCGVNSLGDTPCLYFEEDESYVRGFNDRICDNARSFLGAKTGADSRPISLPEASAEAAHRGPIPPACPAEQALGIS